MNKNISLNYQIRINLLKKLKDAIFANQNEILQALKEDMNKSHYETTLTEIIPTIAEINFFLSKKQSRIKFKKVGGIFSKYGYIYNPRGNVLIINSWNYPFQLLFIPLVGSIIAGNYNTLKFHPYLNKLNKVMEKIILQIDSENRYIKIDKFSTIEETLQDFTFDFVFFTGSYATSQIILKNIDINKTDYCFELGGKSPFIVTKDANIKKAAKMFIYAKMMNFGQTCVAPDYIFIDKAISNLFMQKVDKLLEKIIEKDPSLKELVNLIPLNKAEVLEHSLGAKKLNDKKVMPKFFKENNLDSAAYKEEIFAPIAPIFEYEHICEFEQVYKLNPNPLSMYIFSKSKKDQNFFTSFIAGNYMINNTMGILENNKLSFGGIKQSGKGRYRGFASLELFSHKSSYTQIRFDLLFKLKNLPYTVKKEKILNLYLKMLKFFKF
ncbi:aldehyde dehydrogenase family protein [Mycoplasmopsis gallinacea]|uniref:Aldehyde dehydrogenase n=1 Tax=Mycoplasmopsis gallinacea TaxID=29556 RepID=A0A449A3Y2_9BACT|nr:aldehyde dehydrogenase family protein [Mycoplasmopsis gallinacea]VEU58955.1 NAD-dependent aldehyde dehydrogenase domain-containing protein [Mycoplasmopsis gallinacea]